MIPYEKSSRVTLWAGRAVAAVVTGLLVFFPALVERYHQHFRPLLDSERIAITAGFYLWAIPVLLAMWKLYRLLSNILKTQLFTLENVSHIRVVRWCCFAVSAICLGAAFGFPSLFFLSAIMAFLALVITVVGQVMKAAVELREENDLTV